MKTRGIIGQRIVAIRQTVFYNRNTGTMHTDVTAIELENGTVLCPVTVELDSGGDYAHDFGVHKPKKRLRKKANPNG